MLEALNSPIHTTVVKCIKWRKIDMKHKLMLQVAVMPVRFG